MSKTIKTKNKFEVVFYMSHGLSIQSVTFHKEKDKIIPKFEITGEILAEVSSRYFTGRAIISLTELEENIKKLEELIKNEFKFFMGGDENEG